jgi:hypothetical protein
MPNIFQKDVDLSGIIDIPKIGKNIYSKSIIALLEDEKKKRGSFFDL